MKTNIQQYVIICILFFTTSLTAQVNDSKKNVDLAKQSFAAFNKHDWKAHASFFSDSCKYLDPSYGTEHKIVSRTEKAAKYKKMEETSSDITDNITCIFGVDDKVVIQFTSTGTAKTDKGPYKWSLPICCVFTFKNGLIVSDDTYYDRGN